MEASLNLLVVFISLKNHSYVKAILLQFLMYGYWKTSNHPAWKLIKSHPHSMLEEDGEISLSLLSHAASSHSRKHDIQAMSKVYQLFQYYRQTVAETMLDCKIRVGPRRRSTVSNTDLEVRVIVRHFTRIIGQLRNETWMHYPNISRDFSRYERRHLMWPLLLQSSSPRKRMVSISDEIKKSLTKMNLLLLGHLNTTFWMPENIDSHSESNAPPVMAVIAPGCG